MVAREFAASEYGIQPAKTVAERESDLITDYKLNIDYFSIPHPFKIPHGWMEEDKGMAFGLMLSCPDMFDFFMFYHSVLGSEE